MIEHYQDLITELQGGDLQAWADVMPEQISNGLCTQRYGDLPGWLAALAAMPNITATSLDLKESVTLGAEQDCNPAQREQLASALQGLIPWRKGPYHIHGIEVNTEWRSDWKWDRLLPHIKPLAGKTVLDVGCGNGYHCWRAYGEQAARVIGIDPSPRFIVQFAMVKRMIGRCPVHVLPVAMEQVPARLAAFDTTFSMGVLYHRRSPFDHLRELRETLRPGGQLVLETLVVDGPEGTVLVPRKRYAMMNNVWFLPSCDSLVLWLQKVGFTEVQVVDVNETTTDEQRQTEWMKFHSLEQFLHPDDSSKTIEGYPRPKRAILTAVNPG